MIRLRKNLFVLFFSIIALGWNSPRPAVAANSDIWAVQGSGSLYNVDVVRIDSSGNLLAAYDLTVSDDATITGDATITAPSDLYMGSSSSVISTATTSGSSQGILYTAYLSGDTNAAEGSLLIATTSVAGQGFSVAVSLASNDQTNWVGIAAAATSTGSAVNFYTAGGVVLVLTTGTVVAGDVLVSSAGARGYLGTDTTPTTGADVAVALGGGVAAGGLVKARLR